MKKFFIAAVLLICCVLSVNVCAEGISYTDSLSGLHITLPDGWDEMHAKNADMSNDIYFTASEDMPIIALYVIDIYEEAKAQADLKQLLKRIPGDRFSYDNSMLSKEIMAETQGWDEDKIATILVGGREYFSFQVEEVAENGDVTVANSLIRMENGFCYVFFFYGPDTHPRYDDFLAMVADAEYPIYSMDEKSVMDREVLIVLVSLILHCLPIVLFRYGIRKAPVGNAKVVSILYGIGAVAAGWVIGGILDVANIGVCAIGIAIAGYLNYRMLSM